jgi:hypothetical protein
MIQLELKDGKELSYEKLQVYFPNVLRNTSNLVDLCHQVADKVYKEATSKNKLYVNLLFNDSECLRIIASLIYAVRERNLFIKKIIVNKSVKKFLDLNNFFDGLEVEYVNKRSIKKGFLNDVKMTKLLFKVCGHKLYRVLGHCFRFKSNARHSRSMVRCYTEITGRLFCDQMEQGLCVFMPFSIQLVRRQMNFYKLCKRENKKVNFWGVPYSFWRLLRCFCAIDKDRGRVMLEYSAYNKHAKELSSLGLRSYYTEDDYVPASFLVGEALKNANCYVLDKSHGLGNRCPYVGATDIEVISTAQYDFYKRYNESVINYQEIDFSPIDIERKSRVRFVFIQQGFEQFSYCEYELNLEKFLISMISKLYNDSNLDVYIKYHPNSKWRTDELPELEVLSYNSEDLDILISVYSTIYFSEAGKAVSVFSGDYMCTPYNLIGEHVPFWNKDVLVNKMLKYSNIDKAKELYLQQRAFFENREKERLLIKGNNGK